MRFVKKRLDRINIFICAVTTCLLFITGCTVSEKRKRYFNQSDAEICSLLVVNRGMHTGIVLYPKESAEYIQVIESFSGYQFVDFGWGDEDYYQHHGPACILGAKALFLPTSGVLRVEGFSTEKDYLVKWSDFAVEFTLSIDEYRLLCEYIDGAFSRTDRGELIRLSERGRGEVVFFESEHCYHLFKTCNTWVALALNSAGFDFSTCCLITADDLYDELKTSGTILKGG